MKKIIIIGAGISGLTAGIFGIKSGFEVEIFEMHSIAGGECTGWSRKNYHFDNCIHWLTGTNKESDLYKVWEEIGALENTEIEKFDYLYSINYEGKTLYLYSDLEKLKNHLLDLSSEDKEEIEALIAAANDMKSFSIPTKKPMDMMNIIDYIKLAKSYGKAGKHVSKFDKLSLEEYSMRFKSAIIRKAITSSLPEGYSATPLFFLLGSLASGDCGWPRGGSLAMSQRIEKKFKSLGGKINYNSKVKSIVINENKASGIELANGKTISGDYIISTIDAKKLLSDLLEDKYKDGVFDKLYNNTKDYPIHSSVNLGLGVKCDLSKRDHSASFEVEPFKCGSEYVDSISIKHYCNEKEFSPEGCSSIRVNIMCNDYEYWKELKENNKELYYKEKEGICKNLISSIEKIYPEIIGNVEVTDVCTPVTYERYCGAYRGAWMAFDKKANVKSIVHKGKIKDISNLYVGGQWIMSPGGLPVACLSGKWAIQKICTIENKRFYFKY